MTDEPKRLEIGYRPIEEDEMEDDPLADAGQGTDLPDFRPAPAAMDGPELAARRAAALERWKRQQQEAEDGG